MSGTVWDVFILLVKVVGVFADPAIATCLVCPGDPAVGTDQDVAGLLGVGVNVVARALERRVLAWHPSTRRESAA